MEPDPWDGVDITQVSQIKSPSYKAAKSLPKRQQAIIDAIETGSVEELKKVLTPSKVRSTPISQSLGKFFSPQLANLLFDAGWINPGVVWKELFESKAWEGMSWWMKCPDRIVALEEEVGIANIRRVEATPAGSKSLLGAGGVWDSLSTLATSNPEAYLDMVITADWNTLLRGGWFYHLPSLIIDNILDAAVFSQSEKKSALALERMLHDDVVNSLADQQHSRLRSSPYKKLFNLDPVLTFLSVQDPSKAAKIQRVVNQSPIILDSLALIWKNLDEGKLTGTSLVHYSSQSMSMSIREKIHIMGESPTKGSSHSTPIKGWLEYLIATASPTIIQAFTSPTSSPGITHLRERVVERIMNKPILLAHLAEKTPNENFGKLLPEIYKGLTGINSGGSSFAHIVLASRPNVSVADVLSRLTPPLDLVGKVDPMGQTAVSFIDPTYQTNSFLNRMRSNYTRISRTGLSEVSKSIRKDSSNKNRKPTM